MQTFSPEYFFDLSEYEHAPLFENKQNVWEVFKVLKHYIAGLKLGIIEIEIPAGVHLIHPELISIGKGSVVEPGAYIKGPCFIGKNCTVRHGAYIRGDLLTGDHCVIGHDTEIKHSILLNNAHAAHFAYVGDSILGNNVNLGAGTICANLKFDNKEVDIKTPGGFVNSDLRKLGAILGDNSQTGCNTVTNYS